MRKAILLSGLALLLLSCGPSRYSYPPPSEAPLAPQPNPRPPAPQHVAVPLPNPHNVKPLGAGLLTVRNVGNYMDEAERDLRAELRGSGVGVGRPGDAVTLYLRDDVIFQPNSLALSAAGTRILTYVAATAAHYDSTAITVNGYSDTSVPPGRSLQLSQQHANAVAQALIAAGINPRRIDTRGYGSTHLKIPTGPNFSEPRNRRVEILITPKMAA